MKKVSVSNGIAKVEKGTLANRPRESTSPRTVRFGTVVTCRDTPRKERDHETPSD
ncbi:hypothetical protein [Thermoactinomyces sp. DSM 45892]|uniref:hypothetical protein n=1 Tax=Thermoactinomyces sp. DSM 45892 TaxID=1882753 RepID=UPI00089988A1|nr:hypothetical protein [Thermoactinomyces sp. DSM 45892]SDZ33180.1 hypothetical protein SAMN05444416_1226 [Thermoactinomyces sp. DSM 45892]